MTEPGSQTGSVAVAAPPLRQVTPVVLSSSIIVIAAALMTTRVSLDLEVNAASVEDVRLVVTGYPVGFIIGCLTIRKLVEWFGHGVCFLSLIAVSTAFTLAFIAFNDPVAWFLLRLGSGFAMSAMFTIAESWINLDSRSDNRGALFSYYMILSTLGTAVGPALVGVPLAGGAGAYVLSAVIFAAAVLPLILSGRMRPAGSVREGKPRPGRSLGLFALFLAAPAAFVAGLQTGMTNMPFGVMTPIYAMRLGYTPAEAGALVSVFALGGLLAQWPVGWLSDRFPRRKVLAGIALAAALSCFAILTLAHISAVVLFSLVFLFGISALSIYPVAVAYAGASLNPEFFVSLSSRLLLLHGIGSIIAPALSNELMARFGPSALFTVLGAATFSVGAIAMLGNPFNRSRES
jgi:MFS family permease